MDSMFFYLSKIIWFVISPDHFLVLLFLSGVIAFYLGFVKWARRLLSAGISVVLFLTFFPLGEWLLQPLEARFPVKPELPETIDGIIVLSGAEMLDTSVEWGQVELNRAAERHLAFMKLARQYPDARHVYTGASGKIFGSEVGGAEIAELLYEEQGLDVSKIEFEREARNTYENAVFTKEMVKPRADENWILITTSWHMPRSVGIFRNQNWYVHAYPVDHLTTKTPTFKMQISFADNLDVLTMAVKEWIGLLAYYLTGKTSQFFPEP